LKRISEGSKKHLYVTLPKPIWKFGENEICIIVFDNDKESVKEKIEKEGLKAKVIRISKVKKDYNRFEAKRKFCDSYVLFFADKRLFHQIASAVGKYFFKKKKHPILIDLNKGNIKNKIERIMAGTFFDIPTGAYVQVKLASTLFTREEIIKNIVVGIKNAVEILPKKWKNIQAVNLKNYQFSCSSNLQYFA